MKTFLAIFLSFTLFSLISFSYDNIPDKDLHQKCIYPTVQIFSSDKHHYGTGVIVKSVKINENEYYNVFITAAHVVSSNNNFIITVFDYENWSEIKSTTDYKVKLYGSNEDYDLSVGVFISNKIMPIASINMNSKLFIGTNVFRIGCGAADEPRLDYGKITSVRNNNKNFPVKNVIRTSVHTIPGDSGGPLFNNNALIGIARSIKLLQKQQPIFNMSYYVPISILRDWSKEDGQAYDFVWTNQKLPVIPFWELKFYQDYEVEG